LAPRLNYTLRPRYGPTVEWCGLSLPRLWRCGNQGNVASVLIEKPACGNFLPLVDGGFGLQYSPLLEFREGAGAVIFCQLDVTGRTEADPVAENLVSNLLHYISELRPKPARTAVYVGDAVGRKHLESAGFLIVPYDGGHLTVSQVLVVGHGGDRTMLKDNPAITDWLKTGGNLITLGINQDEANTLLPGFVTMATSEHIATYFESNAVDTRLRGIGPADLHNRDPRELSLVTRGAKVVGNGVLATADNPNVVFCQFAPWDFNAAQPMNLKRTFRRASFVLARLLTNLEVASRTPLLARLNSPLSPSGLEKRWLDGLYLDQPEEWDDPYRFFRW